MSSDTGYSFDDVWNVGYANLGLLWKSGIVKEAPVFYCPAMPADSLSLDSYKPWPTPDSTKGRIRTGYYHNPYTDGAAGGNGKRTFDRQGEFPADKILLLDVFWLDTGHPKLGCILRRAGTVGGVRRRLRTSDSRLPTCENGSHIYIGNIDIQFISISWMII
jgi:hypothetical protein